MLWNKSEWTRMMLSALGVASLLLAAPGAKAACGSFSSPGQGSAMRPMLAQAESDVAAEDQAAPAQFPIVGLWHVVYTAGGQTFNESFDEWHSDGTEFENAFLPPAVGNICFGVWKATGSRSVKLQHVGYTFDGTGKTPSNGYFFLDEKITVASDGKTYTGTFTFTTTPNTGTGVVLSGTMLATRIVVD